VDAELLSTEIPERDKEILDSRWASFLANPSSAMTIEQFDEELKKYRA